MSTSVFGTAVRRVEDPRFLRGQATYVANRAINGVLHVAFVRSPVAHAEIVDVDTTGARAAAGVVGVFCNADLGVEPFAVFRALNPHCVRPVLAEGRVRFVGEPVVMVVAESVALAVDACELVVVEYRPLPAVVDPVEALAEGAPVQLDSIGTNLAVGFRQSEEDPLVGASVIVRGTFVNQRVAVVPMETNAITVEPGGDTGPELTVHVACQMPHIMHRIAAGLVGVDPGRMRVISPDVGGGFGGKTGLGAEHIAVIKAAMLLQRPLRWIETRSENMVVMCHGRSQVQYVEMGFDDDGTITGLHCRVVGDAGAYGGYGGGLAVGSTRTMAQGVYRIPKLRYDAAVALTNTTPVGAFRGAGRPEATALLERIIDIGADQLGIDPVDIRLRNLLPSEEFPLTTLTGAHYDTGDYPKALRCAVALAGYDELRREQADRRARGARRQLGIGVSAYVEITAGAIGSEFASVDVGDDGRPTIKVGTSGHGQGHATAFSMLVHDILKVPLDAITFVQSDTAVVPRGGGTGGSRSLQLAGTALTRAAEAVLAQARATAADLLEASVDDIVVTDTGALGVAGSPNTALPLADIAVAARAAGCPLAEDIVFDQAGATFPFGAHVSVVEVDTETGQVVPVRHVAVDDCGRILNPLLVAGQQHGGIAQGIAQALWEHVPYDRDGNPLCTTLAEYGIPSAAELPSFETANTETPTPLNPLGVKGIGESGTIGALPATHNAVIDALRHLGVRHIDMPCTPERVWTAMCHAAAGVASDPWREPPELFARLPLEGRDAASSVNDEAVIL